MTRLALPCLEARIFLVDDVNAPLAADDAAIFVASLGGAQ